MVHRPGLMPRGGLRSGLTIPPTDIAGVPIHRIAAWLVRANRRQAAEDQFRKAEAFSQLFPGGVWPGRADQGLLKFRSGVESLVQTGWGA